MIVLSLFDGISAGQLALERAGIKVDKYYASEIDKYAIAITQYNYPNTVQLGDINNWTDWDIEEPDLILAGSPCQGFSMAGKGLNFEDPRSKLFFTFVDVLMHYSPPYFLLENVPMKKEWEDVITEYLGEVPPIEINSSLVSAQNRRRLYWTNIPNIDQPEDKGILLKDVVFDDFLFVGRTVGRRINNDGKRDDYNENIKHKQRYEIRTDDKSGAITTVLKDNTILTKEGFDKLILSEKALAYMNRQVADGRNHWDFKHHSEIKKEKSATVVANAFKGVPYNVLKDNNCIRYFHPIECERLQTIPDNYTAYGNFNGKIKAVSKTRRYEALGNSWTVDVISYILEKIA